MNKYKIGQNLYWFKYQGSQPDLMSFTVGSIKQNKDGYKYSTGLQAAPYYNENILFDSIENLVKDTCSTIQGYLVNER